MRQICILFSFLLFSFSALFAQTSNGEVSSLVAAENYFVGVAKEKGIKKAFLTVSDEQTILFRPGPVKATDFFNKRNAENGDLSWKPVLAKISKSGDWGFTTGPFEYKPGENTSYGDYVSVWKMNKKGVWKLALDLGVSHPKPEKEPELFFIDPVSSRYFRQRSAARQKQREEMILTSDQLLSKTLAKYNNLAYNVFLADNARLLFPGYQPIIGKRAITDFLRNQELEVNTEPIKADRATGSDLAYTYGSATINQKGRTRQYHYVRIWEVQDGHKWNVIVEVFTPAES
jgi:ketosteroid isomerase-like protein